MEGVEHWGWVGNCFGLRGRRTGLGDAGNEALGQLDRTLHGAAGADSCFRERVTFELGSGIARSRFLLLLGGRQSKEIAVGPEITIAFAGSPSSSWA
jgi:hypothetical protein